MSRPRILVTGADGLVGTSILPLLRETFQLRLLDLRRMRPEGDDEVVRGDIRRRRALLRACRDVAAVVHLAAIAREADFRSELLPTNVLGTYRVFEAARLARVPKVVFASSCQTVLGYPLSEEITTDMPERPISVYACTKVFGEALGRYYSDIHGLSVICLRIGFFMPHPKKRIAPGNRERWCGPADLARLVKLSVETDIAFGIFNAVSGAPGNNLDLERAREELGFVPRDRIEDYLGASPAPEAAS